MDGWTTALGIGLAGVLAAAAPAAAAGTGHVHVLCEPGVMVFLDGVFQGRSTSELGGYVLEDVPVGKHSIKLLGKGQPMQVHEVVVTANETAVVKARVDKQPAKAPDKAPSQQPDKKPHKAPAAPGKTTQPASPSPETRPATPPLPARPTAENCRKVLGERLAKMKEMAAMPGSVNSQSTAEAVARKIARPYWRWLETNRWLDRLEELDGSLLEKISRDVEKEMDSAEKELARQEKRLKQHPRWYATIADALLEVDRKVPDTQPAGPHVRIAREMLSVTREALAALSQAKDNASCQAARPTMRKLRRRYDELRRSLDKLNRPSPAVEKMLAHLARRQSIAEEALEAELDRVAKLPAGKKLLAELRDDQEDAAPRHPAEKLLAAATANLRAATGLLEGIRTEADARATAKTFREVYGAYRAALARLDAMDPPAPEVRLRIQQEYGPKLLAAQKAFGKAMLSLGNHPKLLGPIRQAIDAVQADEDKGRIKAATAATQPRS